jgi:RNA polymerase sigma-70 factor (ECF subfamily)
MTPDAAQTVWGFPATSWSLVRRVRGGDERAQGEALEALCRAYWRPLYAYARGRGLARADAQDAVQDFFATALRRELFQAADETRGKLRSFLLTAFKRVLLDKVAHEQAARRRPEGGWAENELDTAEAEWARSAASGAGGPDAAFERQWARELLAAARVRTAARYAAEGKADVFEGLAAEALGDNATEGDEAAGGKKIGTTDASGAAEGKLSAGARRVAVFRLRKRFAEALRAVVAETLPEGGEVESELRELGAALRGERA